MESQNNRYQDAIAMFNRRSLTAMAVACVGGAFCQSLSAEPSSNAVSTANAMNGEHPAAYYTKALALFRSNAREDAMFVFYVGQLKFRAHLTARPDLPPGGDPAAFGALSETVGRQLNEWGYGDLTFMDQLMKDVLAYEARNPDRFTPPAQFAAAWASQRSGLERLRVHTNNNAADLRKQRTANGLENRR